MDLIRASIGVAWLEQWWAGWWCSSHSSAEAYSHSNPQEESRQGPGNCLGEVVVETG